MSERPLELDDLLAQLQGEGRLASSGKFSLDLRQAAPKLQKYRLQNLYHYSLKLVQAAVASGAGEVRVECNNQKVRVRYGGRYVEPDEAADLFHYLLESDEQAETRHLRALASAVNSAVGVGARQIWLDCWDGSSGFRHHWSATGCTQNPLKGSGREPYTEFTLLRKSADIAKGWIYTSNCDFWDLITGSRNTMQREQAAIYDHCPFCPIPIYLNNKLINRQTFGEPRWPGYDIHRDRAPARSIAPWWVRMSNPDYTQSVHRFHHLIERYVPAAPDNLSPVIAPPSTQASITQNFRPGAACEAILAVQAELDEDSSLLIVEDGVILCQDRPHLGLAGVVGLVSAHGFTKDLSGFHLVRNLYYQEVISLLRREAEQMKLGLIENADRLPNEVKRALGTHVSSVFTSG